MKIQNMQGATRVRGELGLLQMANIVWRGSESSVVYPRLKCLLTYHRDEHSLNIRFHEKKSRPHMISKGPIWAESHFVAGILGEFIERERHFRGRELEISTWDSFRP